MFYLGVSVILGRMPAEQITPLMKEICWLQVKPLCELLEVCQLKAHISYLSLGNLVMFKFISCAYLLIVYLVFIFLQNNVKVQKGTRTDPVYWLDRLAVIFRHTGPEVQNGAVHPCRDVVTEVLKLFMSIISSIGKPLIKCM